MNSQPLVGVRVSDGAGKNAYSNAVGHYRIEETVAQTYVVTASRAGLVSITRSVTPIQASQHVNFDMLFTLTASVSPRVVKVDPPVSLTIHATASAPTPGLCVRFNDVTAGTATEMTLASTTSSESTWTGTFTIPAGRQDGVYLYRVEGVTCSNATGMTESGTGEYILDRGLPRLRLVSPVDGGNAFVNPLRLAARVTDEGAGIDPASTSITIQDLTAGSPAESVQSSYDAANFSMASTDGVSLITGHDYRVTMSVRDYGGNEASSTADFLAATISVPATNVSIPDTGPVLTASSCNSTTCLWRFDALPVAVDSFTAVISDTAHAGFGGIGHDFSLRDAKLTYTLGGITGTFPLSQFVVDPQDLKERTVYQQIASLAPRAGVQSIEVTPNHVMLFEPIDVRLPFGATNPRLALAKTPSPSADGCDPDYPCDPCPNCPKPIPIPNINYKRELCVLMGRDPICNPDYLVYFISDDEAENLTAFEEAHAQQTAASLSCYPLCLLPYTQPRLNPLENDYMLTKVVLDSVYLGWLDGVAVVNVHDSTILPVPPIEPYYWQEVTSPYQESLQYDPVAGLAYIEGYAPVAPSLYGPLCTFAIACTAPEAQQEFENEVEPAASATAAAQSPTGGGSGEQDPNSVPCQNDANTSTCQERCVYKGQLQPPDTDRDSKRCSQTIKLRVFQYGGRPSTANNRNQTFVTQVTHGRGMRNAAYDGLALSFAPNPNDGTWKRWLKDPNNQDSWHTNKWTRAHQYAHEPPNADECRAVWADQLSHWSIGNQDGHPPEEFNRYTREIWQGNEYQETCYIPGARTTIVKYRLVSATISLSVRENTDYTNSPGDLTPSSEPLSQFVHWTNTLSWDWQCCLGGPKGVPIPYPWPKPEKKKSWKLQAWGKEYWW